MKKQLLFGLLLFLKHKVIRATMWPVQSSSELNVYLQGFNLESSKVDTIFQCYRKCEENIHCASINMNQANKTCELKHSTKTRYREKTVTRQNSIYMEIRDALGSTPHNPIPSCKWFKNLDNQLKSGIYWIRFNEPSSVPFKVFCDMTTDGGGWTLVYSYTFTQYNAFRHGKNAITPVPNWPVDRSSGTWVPQSTTTPLSESSRSAMGFTFWKTIGKEFLIKSNITNWVACVEGTGSLVNWVAGSVTCRVVKVIVSSCTNIAPNRLVLPNCGPFFFIDNKLLYLLEGSTTNCWPVHDPCGTDPHSSSHKTNVVNPSGAMYIR